MLADFLCVLLTARHRNPYRELPVENDDMIDEITSSETNIVLNFMGIIGTLFKRRKSKTKQKLVFVQISVRFNFDAHLCDRKRNIFLLL